MATWQDKLAGYKTDTSSAQNEVLRAKKVYADKQAAGDTAGAEAAHRWANQVREAAGLSDSLYGSGVTAGQATQNMSNSGGIVAQKPDTFSATANQYPGSPNLVQKQTITPDPVEPEFDTKEYIQDLLAAQRRQQLSALEAASTRALTGLDTSKTGKQTALDTAKNNYLTNLDTALQSSMENIGNEEAKIDPYYYDLRNQAQASSDVGAMNFAQYMAGRGIKGGAGAMPEIYRNAGLQGQLGGLNRQQAANQAEIDRTRTTTQNQYDTNKTNVLNNYESDLSGLESEYLTSKQGMLDAYDQDRLATQSGLDAKGLQAFIDQMNADRLFSLNEAGITGKYGGKPTLAGQEFQQKLDDTAKQSWLDTRDRFSDNYQQEINNLQNDNDTTNDWRIPYLESDRQGKLQTQAEQKAAQAAAASEAERQAYLDALNEWKIDGEASDRVASILGIDPGDRTADYDIDKINAATSRKNADTASKNAETAANKPKEQSTSGYKTNPDYAEEVAFIISNPETALATIQQNATALIQKYGYDGYNELLRQATPKE